MADLFLLNSCIRKMLTLPTLQLIIIIRSNRGKKKKRSLELFRSLPGLTFVVVQVKVEGHAACGLAQHPLTTCGQGAARPGRGQR